MEFILTEVLVLGGGIAGMRAALAAKAEGAEVTLLSKGKTGKSGASLVVNTGHRIFPGGGAFPGGDEIAREFIAETLQSGQGLAEAELVDILARESYSAVAELKEMGVPLEFELRNGAPQYARCPEKHGLLIVEKLRAKCEEAGVTIMDGYTVLELVKRADRVVGAYAAQGNDLCCILAKAVVLATGGIGQLYQPTDNPRDIAGESVALAWQCGAELIDLEFVQFYPYQLASPVCMDIHVLTFELGAKLLNERGERVMAAYPKKELETRDVVSREMFLQHGKIHLDLQDVDPERLKQINPRLSELHQAGHELIVAPIQHFFMGGARIDGKCRTTVAGLFACGEAAAGVHGANRLGGNALTECSVFGRRAGMEAAREAAGWEYELQDLEPESIEQALRLPQLGEDSLEDFRNELARVMGTNVGIVRDEEGLTGAQLWINQAMTHFATMHPATVAEWYQTRNMLIAASLISMAAQSREDSRGAHYRPDFPAKDPEWTGHLIVVEEQVLFESMVSETA